jgi:hypothetical protein
MADVTCACCGVQQTDDELVLRAAGWRPLAGECAACGGGLIEGEPAGEVGGQLYCVSCFVARLLGRDRRPGRAKRRRGGGSRVSRATR